MRQGATLRRVSKFRSCLPAAASLQVRDRAVPEAGRLATMTDERSGLLPSGPAFAPVRKGVRCLDTLKNSITPLDAHFAPVVGFAQRYDRSAGVGTIVSLMLPYVVWLFVLWTALFAVWKVLSLPWGL